MSNEQENKTVDSTEDYTVENDGKLSTNEENYVPNPNPLTTMSIISKIFYGFSVLTVIGLFSYLSGITLANVEIMSIQFLIICSYFASAFIFFSFAELFEAVNRIEKNTKK